MCFGLRESELETGGERKAGYDKRVSADLNKEYIKPETVVSLNLLNDTVLITVTCLCLFFASKQPVLLIKAAPISMSYCLHSLGAHNTSNC